MKTNLLDKIATEVNSIVKQIHSESCDNIDALRQKKELLHNLAYEYINLENRFKEIINR